MTETIPAAPRPTDHPMLARELRGRMVMCSMFTAPVFIFAYIGIWGIQAGEPRVAFALVIAALFAAFPIGVLRRDARMRAVWRKGAATSAVVIAAAGNEAELDVDGQRFEIWERRPPALGDRCEAIVLGRYVLVRSTPNALRMHRLHSGLPSATAR